MSKFKVGEDAVVFCPDDNIHNEECVVIGELRRREWDGDGCLKGKSGIDNTYLVDIRGERYCVFPFELRKKPPKEETSSWEEIQKLTNWNPKKEVIHD